MINVFKHRPTGTQCNPNHCVAAGYMEEALGDFNGIAKKLTEGQVQMQINLAKLTEAMGGIKRLDEGLGKLEDKVDENSKILWKVVGIGIALSVVLPVVVQKFLQ